MADPRASTAAPVVLAGLSGPLVEQRDFLLRSLRDLDEEHAAGDLDEGSYERLRAGYTARAAHVLRCLHDLDDPAGGVDGDSDPAVGAVVGAGAGGPVGSVGPDAGAAGSVTGEPGDGAEGEDGRGGSRGSVRWRSPGRRWSVADRAAGPAPAGGTRRRTSRIVALGLAAAAVAAGVSWAVVHESGSRIAGSPVSGQEVGEQQTASLLLAGQQAAAKGDGVRALQDLEAVLKRDPNQIEALASEGWILAQTQQPQLLAQGIGLLRRAGTLDPSYPPTHLYLGIAYLTEEDYGDAVAPLAWYLGHNPDPGLVARVREALAQARAGAARSAPSAPTTVANRAP